VIVDYSFSFGATIRRSRGGQGGLRRSRKEKRKAPMCREAFLKLILPMRRETKGWEGVTPPRPRKGESSDQTGRGVARSLRERLSSRLKAGKKGGDIVCCQRRCDFNL